MPSIPTSPNRAATPAADVRHGIRALTDNAGTWQFVDFVLASASDGALPDYRQLDMMQVPSIVPNLFVIDLRGGYEKGLLIKFSGTLIDEHFGGNIQGRFLEDVYRGDRDVTTIRDLYRRCADDSEVYFRQRTSSYEFHIRGIERGAQDLLIIPISDSRIDAECRRVAYLLGIASFKIKDGITETAEAFFPMLRT